MVEWIKLNLDLMVGACGCDHTRDVELVGLQSRPCTRIKPRKKKKKKKKKGESSSG